MIKPRPGENFKSFCCDRPKIRHKKSIRPGIRSNILPYIWYPAGFNFSIHYLARCQGRISGQLYVRSIHIYAYSFLLGKPQKSSSANGQTIKTHKGHGNFFSLQKK